MSSGTEWPSATVQYRLDLAHALHSVSPSLSALHASRAVALHPETSTILHHSHCPKCGTYRFSGHHPSYLVDPPTRRKRRRASSPHSIALQRRCRLCDFSVDARTSPSLGHFPLKPSAPTIARTKEAGQEQPPSSRPTAGTAGTAKCAPIPPLPGRQPHPKPSHTKMSSLKDMLSRDRQKEEVVKSRKKRKEGHEGLAAFLKEL